MYVCMIESYCPDTHTHTHTYRTERSSWTTKVLGKNLACVTYFQYNCRAHMVAYIYIQLRTYNYCRATSVHSAASATALCSYLSVTHISRVCLLRRHRAFIDTHVQSMQPCITGASRSQRPVTPNTEWIGLSPGIRLTVDAK